MADFLTYKNIEDAIERIIKHFKGSKVALVQSLINMVYFEMLSADSLYPIYWLRDFDDTLACVAPMTITAITAADPGVITVDAVHGLSVSDIVSVYGIVGTTELNNRIYQVNSVPLTTTLSLIDLNGVDAIDTTLLTAYTSGGTITHRGRVLNTTGKAVGRIISAKWHGYNRAMDAVSPNQTEDLNKWWDDATARPQKQMLKKTFSTAGVEANQLLWFPGADAAYDLRYWFEKRVSPMSAVGDVPVMPPQFHHGIVAGVVTRLIEYKVQVENAVIWPRLYASIVNQMKVYNRKFYQETEDHGPWLA